MIISKNIARLLKITSSFNKQWHSRSLPPWQADASYCFLKKGLQQTTLHLCGSCMCTSITPTIVLTLRYREFHRDCTTLRPIVIDQRYIYPITCSKLRFRNVNEAAEKYKIYQYNRWDLQLFTHLFIPFYFTSPSFPFLCWFL